MAGKADIVNGIVGRPPGEAASAQEGWNLPESYVDGGVISTMSGSPPEDGSVRTGGGGGGGGAQG